MQQRCHHCSASWTANACARYCPLCGAAIPPPAPPPPPPPSRAAAPVAFDDPSHSLGVGYGLWALCLVGAAGIHRFYAGRPLTGLLWLLTWGLLGIGSLVDLFRMPSLIDRAPRRSAYSL